MTRRELALRKELALAHLRIARAELRLGRQRKSDALSMWSSGLSLIAAVLSHQDLGSWSQYARLAVSVARGFVGVKRALAADRPRAGATGGAPSNGAGALREEPHRKLRSRRATA